MEHKKDKRLYNHTDTDRFDMYYFGQVGHAIKESISHPELFRTDPVDLKGRPGTMIGMFLEELLR